MLLIATHCLFHLVRHKKEDTMHWESCDSVFQTVGLLLNLSDLFSQRHFIRDSCLKYLFCVYLFAFCKYLHVYMSACPVEACIWQFNLCNTQAKTTRTICNAGFKSAT